MKSIGKLTDEEDDGMIPDTDGDDTLCSEQLADTPVPQIADNRGSCHSTPRERIPERAIAQIVNVSRHTHSGGEHRQRFSVPRSKLRTHRMRRLSQGKIHQ